MSILKSKRVLIFIALLAMLTIAITLPVTAQPKHTGKPEIKIFKSDEPQVWAIPPCDTLYGYSDKVQITLVSQDNRWNVWYDENDVWLYVEGKVKEHVLLTALHPDGTFGKSVNLKLEYSQTNDKTTGISTISGLRSGIIEPDGGLDVVNVGQLVTIADPQFWGIRGQVLSISGRWDAVEGDRFDHIKYACGLVQGD